MGQLSPISATTFRVVIRSMTTQPSSFSDWGAIWQRVGAVFTTFAAGAGSLFTTAQADFLFEPIGPSTLNAWEPVVYLLDSYRSSIIRRRYNMTIDPSDTGNSYVGGALNLSEVYLAHDYHDTPETLANTMIHELMHNKLNMDNAMHSLAPFVGGAGGFMQEALPHDLDLSASSADISQAAPRLSAVVPQQVGV